MALVEKIECTAGGVILFACTSVETPKIPPIHGKTRTEVKLQGWILEPLATSPPATKITYIIQENMKGWVPGFAKKSIARRPLVIATIDAYLQKKAERLRAQNRMAQQSSANTTVRKIGRRPSIMNMEPTSTYVFVVSLEHCLVTELTCAFVLALARLRSTQQPPHNKRLHHSLDALQYLVPHLYLVRKNALLLQNMIPPIRLILLLEATIAPVCYEIQYPRKLLLCLPACFTLITDTLALKWKRYQN